MLSQCGATIVERVQFRLGEGKRSTVFIVAHTFDEGIHA